MERWRRRELSAHTKEKKRVGKREESWRRNERKGEGWGEKEGGQMGNSVENYCRGSVLFTLPFSKYNLNTLIFFQPNHPLYNFSLKEYTHAYLFSFPFSEYHISIREIYIQNRYMLFQKDINKVKIVDIVNTSLSPYAC